MTVKVWNATETPKMEQFHMQLKENMQFAMDLKGTLSIRLQSALL